MTRVLALNLIALWVGLDQLLKLWALTHLTPGISKVVVEGGLSLTLAYNTGAAWGLGGNANLPLTLLRLGVGLALVIWLATRPPPPHRSLSLALIASGALGNAIDGLRLGKVVDMLDFRLLSRLTQALYAQDFPISNLADVGLVMGILLLITTGSGRSANPTQQTP